MHGQGIAVGIRAVARLRIHLICQLIGKLKYDDLIMVFLGKLLIINITLVSSARNEKKNDQKVTDIFYMRSRQSYLKKKLTKSGIHVKFRIRKESIKNKPGRNEQNQKNVLK